MIDVPASQLEEHIRYEEMRGDCDPDYLTKLRWVAKRVPKSVRRDDVSLRHHMLVASLPPATQQELLAQFAATKMPVHQAHLYMKAWLKSDLRAIAREARAKAKKRRPK